MGAVVVFLRATGIRDDSALKNMSVARQLLTLLTKPNHFNCLGLLHWRKLVTPATDSTVGASTLQAELGPLLNLPSREPLRSHFCLPGFREKPADGDDHPASIR